MDKNDIIRKLGNVNWNFDFNITYSNDTPHPFNCRELYSYPATFIPEIPYALIDILSEKGDTVVDPFGGIGTTFMQALILERKPYSFDINPVASQVCETIYRLFDPSINLNRIQDKMLAFCNDYDDKENYVRLLSESRQKLNGWYETRTFNQVAFLIQKYEKEQDPLTRDALRLIISSLMVTLSSQNKGWAYIADNVKPKQDELRAKSVFEFFRQTVKKSFSAIESQRNITSPAFSSFYSHIATQKRVFTASFSDSIIENDSINLIVTSPPYPRMIDYVKSQRLVFGFLDKQFNDYMSLETGARYRRSNKDALREYEDSLNSIHKMLSNKLKSQGFFCEVLPDYDAQDDRQVVIDNIISQCEKLGLEKVYETGRYIPSHKRTLSIQWATLVNERIVIFQKE